MESKCHNLFSYEKIHKISKIYILYIFIYICVYVYKSFSTTLDKGLKERLKKGIDGEVGKHKLNEMAALNIE